MEDKLDLYEKAGVKEYWIADPLNDFVQIYRLKGDKNYGKPEIYIKDDKLKTYMFPDLEIDLSLVFKRL